VTVVVATVRALKMHGGVAKNNLAAEDVSAVHAGLCNLRRHIENMLKFGVPVVVAINHFTSDTQAEVDVIVRECGELGISAHLCTHWAEGAEGTRALPMKLLRWLTVGQHISIRSIRTRYRSLKRLIR